jgi:hypothetical protein
LTPSYIATLINPKTRELFDVHRQKRASVNTFNPGLDSYSYREGEAYWDSDEVFAIDGDTYVRSHSPAANVTKGRGNGAVLYMGLSLRAFSDDVYMGIASSDGGEGHSTRSSSADKFWTSAVRNDLADETTVEAESEERTHEIPGSDLFDGSCSDVGDEECIDVTDVSGDVTLTYTAQGGEIEAQYMPAEKVADAGLIYDASGMDNKLEYTSPPTEVLLGLDFGNCYDILLIQDVISRVMKDGHELDYLERLLSTVRPEVHNQLDVAKQLKLPFRQNGRYKKNPDVERTLKKVWDVYYGGLQSLPDFEE